MKYIKSNITEEIQSLRWKLYQQLKAPIDAMWEQLYIDSSQHYLIQNNNASVGYCCINEDKSLLQLYLEESYHSKMDIVIGELINHELIQSASLSSKEPIAFNACLNRSKSLSTNTFCYEHLNQAMSINTSLNLEEVTSVHIPAIKDFLKEQIGMEDTFGYTENLVSRKEIFMLREDGLVVATSECRLSDSQTDIADLGIIVNRDFQGKGIATELMKMQVNRVLELGKKPICSTTLDNKASQKAIEKAGFYSSHIIFDMKLQ